jgi:hypothetical protein
MRSSIDAPSFGVLLGLAIGVGIGVGACGGDPVSRTLGARCEVARDCVDRCLGPNNDYPDGFCTLDCADSNDCPSDAECIDREGGVCLFFCIDDRDCGFLGPRWSCREENLREDTSRRVRVCRGS